MVVVDGEGVSSGKPPYQRERMLLLNGPWRLNADPACDSDPLRRYRRRWKVERAFACVLIVLLQL